MRLEFKPPFFAPCTEQKYIHTFPFILIRVIRVGNCDDLLLLLLLLILLLLPSGGGFRPLPVPSPTHPAHEETTRAEGGKKVYQLEVVEMSALYSSISMQGNSNMLYIDKNNIIAYRESRIPRYILLDMQILKVSLLWLFL